MTALFDLREMLCRELEEYGKKGELSAGALEIVDKLTHTIKNLDKIIETMEGEDYSGASYYQNDGYGGMSRTYGRTRMRNNRGQFSSRGYSRTGDLAEQLREMMQDAPDERTRQEIQRLADRLEH